MDKRDLFDFACIPLIILITIIAFFAAYMGWV